MKQSIITLMKNVNKMLKKIKHPKGFIEYSNNMHDVYEKIEEYNPGRKCNVVIFDDTIAYRITNKKLNATVTELFIRGRKSNILLFSSHNLIVEYQAMLD